MTAPNESGERLRTNILKSSHAISSDHTLMPIANCQRGGEQVELNERTCLQNLRHFLCKQLLAAFVFVFSADESVPIGVRGWEAPGRVELRHLEEDLRARA